MRRIVAGIVLSLFAAGCRDVRFGASPATIGEVGGPAGSAAMAEVAAGRVRALVPDRWRTVPT